ncbi:MAG TPA: response regulator [Pyrinomonadaceae bacterium]
MTVRKLLLADDSVTIQKVVDLTFSDEGMEVVTVGDGEQALARLAEMLPDIVLADVHMPGRSGYEVCEYIKQDERLQHIPVLLLVGSFEPFDETEARRVGADDHLTKPFQSIKQLIGKVGKLLGGGAADEDMKSTMRLTRPDDAPAPATSMNEEELERATADTAPLPAVHVEREGQMQSGAASLHESSDEAQPFEYAAMSSPASESLSGILDQQDEDLPAFETAAHQQAVDEDQVQENWQPFHMEEIRENAYAQAGTGPQVNVAANADDMLLDLGDPETASTNQEPDDFILDLEDQAFYGSPQSQQAAAPSQNVYAASDILEEERTQPAASSASLAGWQATGEADRDESLSMAEPQPEAAQDAPLAQPPQAESASAAASHAPAGLITLDQLAPEVIEAIARRAVEQLSERVVQEIAWEVVPQLAELLIKRRLEEEQSQPR